MFSKFFGLKNEVKQEITSVEAIQKLHESEIMLQKKQAYLEKQIEEQIEIIKKNGTKNKRVALQALKKKKRLEQNLQTLDGTLTTLQYQRESLEEANSNTEVFKAMTIAGKALKKTHNDLDIDKVEELMDEVKEQQQIANEISSVISNPTVFGQDIDEDELLKELEDMEQEQLQIKTLPELDTNKLPEVPSHSIVTPESSTSKVKSKEDEDLEELRQWAS